MKRIPIILFLFLIIIFSLNIRMVSEIESFYQDSEIPKIIWSFWDGEVPDFIHRCVNTWRLNNPEYSIKLLNKSDLYSVLPDVDFNKIKHLDKPQRFSDMVRLHLLSRYGGIWMDASIICNKPLNWVHNIQTDTGCEFVGYYLDGFTEKKYCDTAKVIENWFFACVPGCKFVRNWLIEFSRISDYETIEKYVENVRSNNVSSQFINDTNYLAMHVACQKVLQHFDVKSYKLHLLKAEDSAYKYLVDNNWNTELAIDNGILKKKYDDYEIIKLRGGERKYMSSRNYKDYFDN